MAVNRPRYDGHAEWYDETFIPFAAGEESDLLTELLGGSSGEACLDIACGTGRHGEQIARLGYRVIGVDVSADQLGLARHRIRMLVRGDARWLPVRDDSVAAAVGMYVHTDVEDFSAVVREIARCLRPGGRLAYIGLHPCYIGAFVDRTREADELALRFEPGYGEVGWATRGSGGGIGLWSRVGGHHKTLGAFLNAFIHANLRIGTVIELAGGGTILPRNIAVSATRD